MFKDRQGISTSRSEYTATGLSTQTSWFFSVFKQMLRWFHSSKFLLHASYAALHTDLNSPTLFSKQTQLNVVIRRVFIYTDDVVRLTQKPGPYFIWQLSFFASRCYTARV